MNSESKKLVRETVNEAGEYLKDKLPALPEKPERNSYAHVWHAIKEKFGSSYKDLDDSLVPEILEFVKSVRNEVV